MKKIFVTLLIFIPAFVFFGCASDKKLPENQELLEPAEENGYEDYTSDSVNEINIPEEDPVEDVTEESVIDISTDNSFILNETELEIPEDFEEPQIYDLISDFTEEKNDSESKITPDEYNETGTDNILDTVTDKSENETKQTADETIRMAEIQSEENIQDEILEKPKKNNTKKISSDSKKRTEDDISIDNDDIEVIDEITEDEENNTEEIVPSRSATLKLGDLLDLSYPGKGWIFLGSIDGSVNLISTEKKLGDKDTNFVLLARNAGTSILHFYKEDVLADKYLDDYIEVTVLPERSKTKSHVMAPKYKPYEKRELPVQTTGTEKTQTPSETKTEKKAEIPKSIQQKPIQSDSVSTDAPVREVKTQSSELPSNLLAKARKALEDKNYEESYNLINEFLSVSDSERDEGLMILAKIYESESKLKNIKLSIETYNKIKTNYPSSPYWDEANKRIIYLNRFYINIR